MSTPGRLLFEFYTVVLALGVTTYQAKFKSVNEALEALDAIKQVADSQGFQPVA